MLPHISLELTSKISKNDHPSLLLQTKPRNDKHKMEQLYACLYRCVQNPRYGQNHSCLPHSVLRKNRSQKITKSYFNISSWININITPLNLGKESKYPTLYWYGYIQWFTQRFAGNKQYKRRKHDKRNTIPIYSIVYKGINIASWMDPQSLWN